MKQRFDRVIRESLDHFIENYHASVSDRERISTNRTALDFIKQSCKVKGYDPKPYKEYYLGQVRSD